jgi:hypothetical protein
MSTKPPNPPTLMSIGPMDVEVVIENITITKAIVRFTLPELDWLIETLQVSGSSTPEADSAFEKLDIARRYLQQTQNGVLPT